MSINYSLRKQEMKIGKHSGKALYFAQFRLNGLVSFHKLCEQIAEGSTISKGEAVAVLYRLAEVIKQEMEQGKSVDCGDLGIFRPAFSSDGVERAEDFNVRRDMRKPKVTFRPKKNFGRFSKVSYHRLK